MKANEAPEKLYIALSELTEDGHTSVLDHRVDYPICTEYTRTDVFIEKACEYLGPILTEYAGFYVGGDILQYFKNYMKGEPL